MSIGKKTIGKLMDDINFILNSNDWDPKGVSSDSTIMFIEAKAMLINTKTKLKSISKREGYE